ncbi:MAG: VWA domain-containing protein [Arenimonas sp.]
MRLSPLALAITLTLAACSQPATRQEATTPLKDGAIAATDVAAVESTSVVSEPMAAGASVAADAAAPKERDELAAASVVEAEASMAQRSDSAVTRTRQQSKAMANGAYAVSASPPPAPMPSAMGGMYAPSSQPMAVIPEQNTEHYAGIDDNPVQRTAENPVSTFSIDVDTGSYSNVRRMLVAGQRPPKDAVRAEEMLNYFDYGYPAPATREVPFLVSTEIAPAPWNSRHQLLQVGIQGFRVDKSEIPAANLVFLVDTSGSMQDANKLPLLKESFRTLVRQLRPQDRVTLVAYAGSAGLVLAPTSGADKGTILAALDRLEAGGSTNGGEGLQLAYAMAKKAYIPHGVNRVMLATDGDFNVGTFDQKALETMIGDQRKSGIALTTLGFGTGNYNDSMAERLADLGDGNHSYIDSINEGRKVLVEELSSTMMTIAQDVKIQVEFNPAVVAEYRLIGYENRALRREDFNNDKVDAGEIGAGHDVTALYELTLVGSGGDSVDPLRYGARNAATGSAAEIATLKLRYKQPGGEHSRLLSKALTRAQIHPQASPRLRWSAAVAAYADLLRGGTHSGSYSWNDVRALAAGAKGEDRWGYRAEFLDLVDKARVVTGGQPPVAVNE